MKKKLSGWIVLSAAVLIFIIPSVWLFSMAFKTWHIFTDSRIEKVEQVFNITLPANVKPERYTERLMGQNMVVQELYITGISVPENFIENSIRGRIVLSSGITDADDDVRARYKSEWWYDKTEHQTEYICVYESGQYRTQAYFFKNENGYDLKLIR